MAEATLEAYPDSAGERRCLNWPRLREPWDMLLRTIGRASVHLPHKREVPLFYIIYHVIRNCTTIIQDMTSVILEIK
jgi:hypothetical protein